jgi:hypothetical protein
MNQLSEYPIQREIQDLMTSGQRRAGAWGLILPFAVLEVWR